MKAKIIRQLTGKVLVEFKTEHINEIMDATSFFDLTDTEAKGIWDGLWSGVRGGEIARIVPTADGWQVQVRNEFIEWEVK